MIRPRCTGAEGLCPGVKCRVDALSISLTLGLVLGIHRVGADGSEWLWLLLLLLLSVSVIWVFDRWDEVLGLLMNLLVVWQCVWTVCYLVKGRYPGLKGELQKGRLRQRNSLSLCIIGGQRHLWISGMCAIVERRLILSQRRVSLGVMVLMMSLGEVSLLEILMRGWINGGPSRGEGVTAIATLIKELVSCVVILILLLMKLS